MLVIKNFSERWTLTLPLMHTNTLIGLLIENELQRMIWLQRQGVEPKNEWFPSALILSVPGKYIIGMLR